MAKSPPQIRDITDRFDDVNPYDRIYQCERGYTVKVRAVDRSSSPGALNFQITGSWVNDKTGKAKLFNDVEPFIVAPHEVSVQAESEVDLAGALEEARLVVVKRTSLTVSNHYAKQALLGVKFN